MRMPSLKRPIKNKNAKKRMGEIFLKTDLNSRIENSLELTPLPLSVNDIIKTGKTNKQQKITNILRLSFKVPKTRVDPLTNKGPNTQPAVLETLKRPKAIPFLFLVCSATKASRGAANAPLATRSMVFENKMDQEAGNNKNALAANARPVEKIKIFFLFFTLSNNTPLAKRSALDINSVVPSRIPRMISERPRDSVTKKGMIVIPTVVEIANKKFIKKILYIGLDCLQQEAQSKSKPRTYHCQLGFCLCSGV